MDFIDGAIFADAFANDTLIIGGRFRNISGENIQHLARISVDEINFLRTNTDEVHASRQKIVVYPNPVVDEINVQFDAYQPNSPVENIHLVSVLGEVVPVNTVRQNENEIQVGLASVKPGVYVLSFVHDGERYAAKIIKNKL